MARIKKIDYNRENNRVSGKDVKQERCNMKLVYAIVHSDDADVVTEELNKNRFSVTKLSSTGGFLRKGNTTLMIGTEDEKVDRVIEIIKNECGKRQQVVYNMPYSGEGIPMDHFNVMPATVDVGGTTIFVVNVERFERS